MQNRVAEIRKQKDEKQEACAKMLGISRVSLSVIENGGTPSAITMLKIARHFEMAIEEIFFEADVTQKQQRE
jgi:DNA-binding XRE family transcriptional regulator